MATIPGVIEATGVTQVQAQVGGMRDPRWLTPLVAALTPELVTGRLPVANNDIILASRPDSPPPQLGPTFLVITTEAGAAEIPVEVVGYFSDSDLSYAGPSAALGASALVNQALSKQSGLSEADLSSQLLYDAVYVRAASLGEVVGVQRALQGRGFDASSVAGAEPAIPEGLTAASSARPWLATLVLLVSIMAGAVVGSGMRADRSREVGVLRAVGWTTLHVTGVHLAEVAVVTMVAALAAVAVGVILSWWAVPALTSFLAPGIGVESPMVDALTAALLLTSLPLGGILGSAPAIRALAKLPPDAALRSLR